MSSFRNGSLQLDLHGETVKSMVLKQYYLYRGCEGSRSECGAVLASVLINRDIINNAALQKSIFNLSLNCCRCCVLRPQRESSVQRDFNFA